MSLAVSADGAITPRPTEGVVEFSVLGVLIATLGGTAVGLERQWSGHADGPSARFGGIRTFTMLGGVSGLCGWLLTIGQREFALVLLAGVTAIIVAAYVAASRQDVDATTEVAALVVVAAGVLAGLGSFQLSSGIIAILSLLLVEKSRLHSAVARIDDVSLRAAVRFGVMALVVLPLLPSGPYGPLGGVRPRELWALALFFSGLSFLGFVARRAVGPGHGYLAAGLIGGLIASTNVTFTFARMSRVQSAAASQLAFGAIAANAVLFPRVLIATTALNAPLVPLLVPYFVIPALVAAGVAAFGARSAPMRESNNDSPGNPLQLLEALRMAALFQLVLIAVHFVNHTWGDTGVLTTAAFLGLTDVDALTMSMARGMSDGIAVPELAARAIAVGVAANTALKLALALVFSSGSFRSIAGGTLAVMLCAALVSLVL
jgi:uncharacterized membrane protein (DUF4010 family)